MSAGAVRTVHAVVVPPPQQVGDELICEIMPHQQEALDSAANVVLPLWGRGGGKSILGITEMIRQALARGPAVGFIIAQTGPMIERYRTQKLEPFLAWFEQLNGFSLVTRYRKTDRIYELITGGQWWLIPSDDPDKLRGPDFAYGVIEEAAICYYQQEIWQALLPTFRMHPDFRLVLPTTPKSDSYFVSHILEKVREQDPSFWSVNHAGTVNRFVDPSFWEMLKGELSPEAWEEEVEAKLITPSGAVYGRFFSLEPYPRGNVIDFDPRRDLAPNEHADVTFWGSIDWGPKATHFLALIRHNRKDWDIIVDELSLDGKSIEESTAAINRRIREYPAKFGLDMSQVNTDPTGKDWNVALRRKLPATCRVRYIWDQHARNIEAGVELVKRRLLDARGVRHLFITEDVMGMPQNAPGGRGIGQSLGGGYQYSKITRTGHFRPSPNKDGFYDHSADTLRYGIIAMDSAKIYRREPSTGVRDTASG